MHTTTLHFHQNTLSTFFPPFFLHFMYSSFSVQIYPFISFPTFPPTVCVCVCVILSQRVWLGSRTQKHEVFGSCQQCIPCLSLLAIWHPIASPYKHHSTHTVYTKRCTYPGNGTFLQRVTYFKKVCCQNWHYHWKKYSLCYDRIQKDLNKCICSNKISV